MKNKTQSKNEHPVAAKKTKEEENFKRHYEEVSRGFDLPANPFRGPSPGVDFRTADAVPLPTTDTGQAMQHQAEFHDTSPLPGIHLLTGISAGIASIEEQELWERSYASSPEAQQKLAWFEEQRHAEDTTPAPEVLFGKGAQLLDELPPLGEDFWDSLEEDDACSQEEWTLPETSSLSVSSQEYPEVSLGEPETEPLSHIESSGLFSHNPPLARAGSWTMGIAATLLMGFLLVWWNPQPNPPNSSSVPGFRKIRAIPLNPPKYRAMGAPETCKDCKNNSPLLPSFEIFYRRDGHIQSMLSQMTPKAGDELRFEYRNPSQKRLYLLVFMLDDKGALSQLYPSREEVFVLPHSAQARYLPGGAILSPSQSAERLYLCVSSKRITYADILPGLKRRVQLQGVEKTSRLSENCEVQRSWLLK